MTSTLLWTVEDAYRDSRGRLSLQFVEPHMALYSRGKTPHFTQILQYPQDFGNVAQIEMQDFVILTVRKDKNTSCKIGNDVL